MSIKNKIRTVLKIRQERVLPPPGPMPQIGSSIVCKKLRIRLKYPIDKDLWDWFIINGWRAVDMRTERREYTLLPDKALAKLIDLEESARDILLKQILQKYSTNRTKTAKVVKIEKTVAADQSLAPQKTSKLDIATVEIS